jgi:hypothetical protein
VHDRRRCGGNNAEGGEERAGHGASEAVWSDRAGRACGWWIAVGQAEVKGMCAHTMHEGRGSACGGRLVSAATQPSVVRMSAECIKVARAGVISRGVKHIAVWLESQTCSRRNAHGSKVGRVKRARSPSVRSARPESKRAHARRLGVTRTVDQICSSRLR